MPGRILKPLSLKSVQTSLTLPRATLDAVTKAAERAGVTLSQWVCEAIVDRGGPELAAAAAAGRADELERRIRHYWPLGYPWERGQRPEPSGGYRRGRAACGTWGHAFPRPGASVDSIPCELAIYLRLVGLDAADWAAIAPERWVVLGKPIDVG